ncbi:MAG: polysaccharide pyruvyl transferase family protein [Clostridiales bacterium]|nr:polysaccharide pyruvyl transferase family protein [Clostridiales bacterium]
MDRVVNIIVKFIVWFSRFAPFLSKTGLVDYRGYADRESDPRLRILLVGYNGARNTGSDVRVAEIVRQLEDRLGRENVEISVMTLDEENIRCYFDEDVRLIRLSSIFFRGVLKACCANQAAILCEGSTLKSKFANALTLYFCEAAGIMRIQHKPCIAYGSEAGEMDAFLERAVKKLCRDTRFIARDKGSLEDIRRLGLLGSPGTDTAWEFDSSSRSQWALAQLSRSGWDGKMPLLGIAPINPFCWPVRPSILKWLKAGLTGDHSRQFQLWYFFSSSGQREQQFEAYLDAIARSVNEFTAKRPCHLVILGMERLDRDACSRLEAKLNRPAAVFLSSEHDGYEMAALLRQLSLLVTSRYHAAVLSAEAGVPCAAISMDERLDNIMQEMGMDTCQLMHADDGNLSGELEGAMEYAWLHRENIQDKIKCQLVNYKDTLNKMGDDLAEFLLSRQDRL